MGCSSSIDFDPAIEVTMSSEEKYFARESTLRYNNAFVEDVFSASVRYSTLQNKLTKPNLKLLLETVGLESRGLESMDSEIRGFYAQLTKQGLYDSRRIKLLAILLSKGTVEAKAKFVFNEFDGNGSKTLDDAEVTSMLTIMCNLALVNLPEFSIKVAGNTKKANEVSIMRTYADKLKKLVQPTINYLRAAIVTSGKGVTYQEFLQKLKNSDPNALCSAPVLRSFAIDLKAKEDQVKMEGNAADAQTSGKGGKRSISKKA